MEYRKTHLINERGDRKVVETRSIDKELQQLNESTNSNYRVDVDWYLNNGYIEIGKARKIIEDNGNNQS